MMLWIPYVLVTSKYNNKLFPFQKGVLNSFASQVTKQVFELGWNDHFKVLFEDKAIFKNIIYLAIFKNIIYLTGAKATWILLFGFNFRTIFRFCRANNRSWPQTKKIVLKRSFFIKFNYILVFQTLFLGFITTTSSA